MVLTAILSTGLNVNAANIVKEKTKNIKVVSGNAKIKTKISIDAGEGINDVKYSINEEGGINAGPEAFTVDDKGNIYILDTLNTRILKYTNNGEKENTIDLAFTVYPKDIIICNGKIYILDEQIAVYELDDEGTLLNIIDFPDEIDSYLAESLYVNAHGNLCIKYIDNGSFVLKDGEFSEIKDELTVTLNDKKTNANLKNKKGEKVATVNFKDGTDSYAKIINENVDDTVIVEVGEVVQGTETVTGEYSLRVLDSTGEMYGVVRIPLEDYVEIPNKYYCITDKGILYLMVANENVLNIQEITFGTEYQSNIEQLLIQADEYQKNQILANTSAADNTLYTLATQLYTSLTRDQFGTRMESIAWYNWVYNSVNGLLTKVPYERRPYVVQPLQLCGLSSGTSVQGIPYCWGGFDSQYTVSSSAYTSFSDAISKGYYAGNTSSHYGDHTAGTVGLDCSGFASAAYGFSSKYGTYSFAGQSTTTNIGRAISTPQAYDYYVKAGSHIVIYTGQSSDGSVIYTRECTTSGSNQCTKSYTRTKSELSGYTLRTAFR